MPLISLLGDRQVKLLSAASNNDDLVLLAELMDSGKVKTVIDRTYRFDQLPDALRYQGEGHARGKTIVTIVDSEMEG